MSETSTRRDTTELTFPRWPRFSESEIAAVVKVMQSGKVNTWTGRDVAVFENGLSEYVGQEYAVALCNGTVALDLALIALGVGPGDEVIVTPRSFIASVACVVKCGATPVFADVDENSQNLSAETIAPMLTKKTKAVIPVHLAGWPCEMGPIVDLAAAHNISIVEDCAQAHGATVDGRSVGSFGVIGCWSFCQDKIMSTGGEGGAITTNSLQIHNTIWSMKEHGKSIEKIRKKRSGQGYRWVHDSIGGNFRLTSIQAAIGSIQLSQLEETASSRNANAAYFYKNINSLPAVHYTTVRTGMRHAYYLAYVFIENDKLKPGWSRDKILMELLRENVPVTSGSCPELYREEAFSSEVSLKNMRLPIARKLGESSLAFKVHPTLKENHIQEIAAIFSRIMAKAVR